jgi:hypothetical protein
MRKSCLLFVFLLLALFVFKLSSSDTSDKFEKPSVELISDAENIDLANN